LGNVGWDQNHPVIADARNEGIYPTNRTIRRYKQRLRTKGHLQPYRPTGNRRSTILVGRDLVLLSIFVKKFPTATGLEKSAFLFNSFGAFLPRPRFYTEAQICRAEQRLGLSRKKCSTSANKAFTPRVLALRRLFWTQPYPLGIADVPALAMIDIDEARIILDQVNRRYAKARLAERARVVGHYKGEGRLLIAAISGSNDGKRWISIQDRSGTTQPIFVQFICSILDEIGPGRPGNRLCLMMDNLNVHHHPVVISDDHPGWSSLYFPGTLLAKGRPNRILL